MTTRAARPRTRRSDDKRASAAAELSADAAAYKTRGALEPVWIDCLRSAWRAMRNSQFADKALKDSISHLWGVRLTIEPYQAMGMFTMGLRALALSDTDMGVVIASHTPRFDLLVIKAAASAIVGQLEIFEAAHVPEPTPALQADTVHPDSVEVRYIQEVTA